MAETNRLQKVTLNLFHGDYQRFQTLYPTAGAADVIRRLLRQHLDNVDRTANSRLAKIGDHINADELL